MNKVTIKQYNRIMPGWYRADLVGATDDEGSPVHEIEKTQAKALGTLIRHHPDKFDIDLNGQEPDNGDEFIGMLAQEYPEIFNLERGFGE